jgi:PAS domain S-box-containing protein
MFIVVCDERWQILAASAEFRALIGCQSDDVLGRGLAQFLDDAAVLPDVVTGKTDSVVLRDRSRRPIEASLRVFALGGGPGRQWAAVGEQLSVRSTGIEKLSGEQFLDNVEGAVLIENHEGYITYANTRMLELVGYTRDQLKGQRWTCIVPPEERRWVEHQVQSRMHGAKNQYETTVLSQTGEKIPVIVNARPVFDFDRYQGAVAIFTDITERKQAEIETRTRSEKYEQLSQTLNSQRARLLQLTDELAKANEELKRLSQAKSDFVSAVSHDLRTPLTTIIEGISLVEDGTLGETNPEQRQFLRLALEDAQRLRDFINDILDLAKIEAGKIVATPVRVDLQEQAARVKRSYDNYVREKGLELIIDVPRDIPPVFADSGHYGRVLMNLLSNAIKFTPAGGRITIGCQVRKSSSPQVSESGDMVETSVEDTGVGIPEAQKHVIFGKFEQVQRSGALQQPGSGLGLSLCRQLIELNHGAIGFKSEENHGSRFFFALPAYDEMADLSFVLVKVGEQAREQSSRLAMFLVRADPMPVRLNQIAEALKFLVRSPYSLRLLPARAAVALTLVVPDNAVEEVFAQLVEALHKARLAGLQVAYHMAAAGEHDARMMLVTLERALRPLD